MQAAIEKELKQYIVGILEQCSLFIGRPIETYTLMELFEVYTIYEEKHDLIDEIPNIREQIEIGEYDKKVIEFLQRNQ